MELTKEIVAAAMEAPIEQDDSGWYRCRMCPRSFPASKAVPVHELVHRRQFGLAPPPHKGNAKAPRYVRCGYDGCQDTMFRTSLPSHLRSRKHGLSRADASFYARQRSDEERGIVEPAPAPLPATVEPVEAEPEIEPESMLTGIAAEEAVTGILSAAVTDGLMPVRMLGSVLLLISHTNEVLEELREHRDRKPRRATRSSGKP